ncbi:MAG: hypothetical protein LBV58_00460 [Acholeplasmatales bacterium]|jgi:hypothetical protein|nr:hypothetical protein [Acholeplasmatales bacterium]
MIPNSNYFSFYLDNFDSLISNDDNFSDTFSYGAYYLINNALVKTGCINSIVSTFGEENAKKLLLFAFMKL